MESTAPVRKRLMIASMLVWAMLAQSLWAENSSSGAQGKQGRPATDLHGDRPPSNTLEKMLLGRVRLTPHSYAANHELGEFYLQRHYFKSGIRFLKLAQQIDVRHYDNGYDLALAYLEVGEAANARAQLIEMLKQKETAEIDNLFGEVDTRLRDYLGAAREYHRAAELDPSEQNIFDLANFLLQHQRYEGFLKSSLQFFLYGTQKYPRSAQLTVGLGVAQYADRQYDEAVKTLCSAVDLNPADSRPFFFLGKVSRISLPLLPEVRKRLAAFAKLYPQNAAANYYYAVSLWERSSGEAPADLAPIEALLKNAISLDPAFYESHFKLGVLYQDQQRYADATREYQLAVKLRPDFRNCHYRLALMYQRAGRRDLADQEIETVRRLQKQDDVDQEQEDSSAAPEQP